MAKPTQYEFTHKEVVEVLLKSQNIHKGIWGLHIKFGIQAANMGGGADDLLPVAIVPLMSIGLQQVEEENNLSVDASKVNPKPRGKTRRKKAQRKKTTS